MMLAIANRTDADSRIDLQISGVPVASYQFGPNLPKPCFYPLYTAAGRQIAAFEPADHLWHRGLWFTIKFINKTNFWEENPPFGVQITREPPMCENISSQSIRILHTLRWKSQATDAVFDEDRAITFTLLPDVSRQIDWHTSLVALSDLLLDRTPYTTWGGYSGLAFRAPVDLKTSEYLLPDGTTTANIIGQPHPWICWRAVLPGDSGAKVSLALIDHPANPRSPQPWYGKYGQKYDFMNAAFLFHEPMPVAKNQRLDFRYRVLYRDGWWSAAELAKFAREFSGLSE